MANPEPRILSVDIIFIGTIAGAIVGAVSVAAFIATANFFSVSSMGAAIYGAFLSAMVGFCYGLIFGGLVGIVVGIVVGLFANGKKLGALIGAIAGSILACFFIASPDDRGILLGIGSIVIGILCGMGDGIVIDRVVESRLRRKTSLNSHH